MSVYRLHDYGVIIVATGEIVRAYSGEPKWEAYLAWLAAGNLPDPILPPEITQAQLDYEAEINEQDQIKSTLRQDAAIQAFKARTPSQVDDWIDNNVTDLASAKVVLKIMAKILLIIARRTL